MLSNYQVYNYLEGEMTTRWTFTQMHCPNITPESEPEKGQEDFARLTINIGKDVGMDIGASGDSEMYKRGHGILILRLFTRKGSGDAVLFDYQDKFYKLFDWVTVEGITFAEKESVGPHDNSTDGDWRVMTCFVNFHFTRA